MFDKKSQSSASAKKPNNLSITGDPTLHTTFHQLIDMGFNEDDVGRALSLTRNDFERALDHLCRLGTERD